MTDAPIVRPAVVGDAEACADVVNDWIDATPWMQRGPSRAEILDAIRAGIPEREFYVVGEPVAGYLSLNPETAQIMGLYVARPGRGLGKALIDRVKAGRRYLQLRSHAPNAAAHRFYAREGFTVVERDLAGHDGVPEIRMEWRA